MDPSRSKELGDGTCTRVFFTCPCVKQQYCLCSRWIKCGTLQFFCVLNAVQRPTFSEWRYERYTSTCTDFKAVNLLPTPQYQLCAESPTFGHREQSAVKPFILQCTQFQQCSVKCRTFHTFLEYKHAGTGHKCCHKMHFLLRLNANTGTAIQAESQVTLPSTPLGSANMLCVP